MIRLVGRFFDYLGYLFFSTNRHGVHSPFVYDFSDKVLYKKSDAVFEDLEYLRSLAINSKGKIKSWSISDFTFRYSLKAKYCQLLHRMVRYYNVDSFIEFGDCIGIESCYLVYDSVITKNTNFKYRYISSDSNQIQNFTFQKFLSSHGFENYNSEEIYLSDIKLFLFHYSENPEIVNTLFENNLANMNENDIVVITNIRYSNEHYISWKQASNHSKITASVELFDLGILFLSRKLQKENFILRY